MKVGCGHVRAVCNEQACVGVPQGVDVQILRQAMPFQDQLEPLLQPAAQESVSTEGHDSLVLLPADPKDIRSVPSAVVDGNLRLFLFSVVHQISNPSCNTWLVALSDRCPAGPGPVGFGQHAGSDGLEPQLRVRRRDTPIHFPQTGSPVATVIASQRDARISQSLGSLSGCADIWRQPAYYKAWRAQQLAH